MAMKFFKLALLFGCIIVIMTKIPEPYTINLDVEPAMRYRQLARAKSVQLVRFISYLYKNPIYLIAFNLAYILKPFLPSLVGTEFYEQCRGIAEGITRDVSQLVVFNYMYELGAWGSFCTSIAVNSGDAGFIGRNLDYGFEDYLSQNSIMFTYMRNNRPLFKTVGHAGLIGAHSGVRLDGYAVTLNERISSGLRYTLFQIFLMKSQTVPYLLMKTLKNARTASEAFSMLSNTRICSPTYYILASESLNSVIERQRNSVKLSRKSEEFLVQTNCDFDKEDPDQRRTIATQKMNVLAERGEIQKTSVWEILAAPPNKNKLTLITMILDWKQNDIQAKIWQNL